MQGVAIVKGKEGQAVGVIIGAPGGVQGAEEHRQCPGEAFA